MSVHPLRSEFTTLEGASFKGKYGKAIGVLTAAVVVVGLSVLITYKGLEYRKAAELQRATEIEKENQTICKKWGLLESPLFYASCSADLNDVRARHERRINTDQNSYGG